MLAQRLLTAAIGIPVVLAAVLIGGALYTAVAAVILALAALELAALLDAFHRDGSPRPFWKPRPPWLAATGAVVGVVALADTGFDEWTGALVGALGVAFCVSLLVDPEDGFRDWTLVVAVVAYVGFLGSYLVLLRDLDGDGHWVLLAVLATWAADTFAYATGKLVGRHRMAPRVSPGKTWEGTAGGLLGGLAAVVALNWPLDLPMSYGEAAVLGLLLPPVAVIADLGESMLKRGARVKDTSELVPGHGGMLDRLDSILFTVPLVYYFAVWVVLG
jgi:phosphatidate cytidylyltransferase